MVMDITVTMERLVYLIHQYVMATQVAGMEPMSKTVVSFLDNFCDYVDD